VNASAPSLDRDVEVRSEIHKVRAFGRAARVVCAAIFGFGLVGVIVALLMSLFAPNLGAAGQLTAPQLKVWVFLNSGLVTGVMLAGVYQLYRLFGNLAAGTIYTHENVRRVRNIGVLWLLSAVLEIAIPFGSTALVSLGFFDSAAPLKNLLEFSWQQFLSSAISAGLVLLASWIMDVGLHAKDHADALQRDADLVI
jgi:hypothetical protein